MAQSPEYLTVLGHIADINSRIPSADLPSFSSELFQAGLITDASHRDAIAVTGLGPGHKVASLTAAAIATINNTPGLFDKFVSILETRDRQLATALRYECHTTARQHGLVSIDQIQCQTAGGVLPSSVDHSLTVYTDNLKRVYQTPPTTWLPLPVSKHIKLVMTKEKGTRYGRDTDDLTRHRVKGEVEQVMAAKTLVDMNSIFNEGTFENARRPLVILAEGALGSGKTTLAYHYCHEWANGNLAMFDLVALVYLRHPAVHSAESSISLDELLLVASGSDDERDIVAKVAECVKGGLKFLLILEGWDEAPANLRAPPNRIHQHDDSFLGKLLRSVSSNTTILITSRPDSSIDLHKRVNRVEILGFTKENIHEYFHEALSTQLSSDEVTVECSKLKEHFSKYPAIESSCYIPLNAAILILVYLDRDRTLPTTQYELFSELLLCCIEREVNTRQPNQILESISSLDGLPHDLKEHHTNISILAYEGIMQNKVVFSQHEVSSILPQPVQQDLPTMGVLQKVQWAGIRCKTMSYSFSHLSIQELLAAYYISKMVESEQVKVFQALLGKPRFSAVLQFYAGFTKLTNQGVRDIITGTDFLAAEYSIDFEVTDVQLFLLSYIKCFFEARVTDESLYQTIVLRMNGVLNLRHVSLSPLDCMSIGYFLAMASRHSQLIVNLGSCNLNDELFGLLVVEYSKVAKGRCALHGVTELVMESIKLGNLHNIGTALQTNTTIRILDMSDCSISDDGAESLARALTVNRSLQELDISHIGDIGIAHIATALQINTTLRKLHVSSHSRISDKGVESLARALTCTKSLQELVIGGQNIGDIGIAHIANALHTNTTLRRLRINNISDKGAESLARALTCTINKSLQELDISSNEIGDIGIAHIATALHTNTTLRTLDVSNCNISDKGAESLARALTVTTSLQELNISCNEIGDKGIAHIANALQTKITLRELKLIGCQISDDGAELLARALAVDMSLQELIISGNEIGVIGIAHIGTALQTNTTLRRLHIHNHTSLSDKGVESLAAGLNSNTSLEYLDIEWVSTDPSSTAEKIGQYISHNNVLRELVLFIYASSETEFSSGGLKLIQSLEYNHVQSLDLTLYINILTDEAALKATAEAVNSTRDRERLPNLTFSFKYHSAPFIFYQCSMLQ